MGRARNVLRKTERFQKINKFLGVIVMLSTFLLVYPNHLPFSDFHPKQLYIPFTYYTNEWRLVQ